MGQRGGADPNNRTGILLMQYLLKFVAMLRDSLQETLDSKVLYAMLILSAFVMLGVASISFEPQPARTRMWRRLMSPR